MKLRKISYSLLRKITADPIGVLDYLEGINFPKSNRIPFVVGDALDTLVSNPEKFNKKFKVIEDIYPGPLMESFISNLPKNITNESPVDDYKKAYEIAGFKLALDTVIANFWKSKTNIDFYNILQNKQRAIKNKDYELVAYLADCLKTEAENYFNENTVYQETIEFDYLGLPFKAILDGYVIKGKTINAFDLKSTANIDNFENSYYNYNYDLQAELYIKALQTKYPDYKITFKFIVIEKSFNNNILIFEHVHNPVTFDNKIWEFKKELTSNSDLKSRYIEWLSSFKILN